MTSTRLTTTGGPRSEKKGSDFVQTVQVGLRDLRFWTISAFLHLVVLVILLGLVVEGTEVREPGVRMTIRTEARRPAYDAVAQRALTRVPDIPVRRDLDDRILRPAPTEVTPDIPEATWIDISSGTAFDPNSIVSWGPIVGIGIRADRDGPPGLPGRHPGRDGSAAAEEAVRAALEWLRRHQDPDGGWKAHDFYKRSKGESRNEDSGRYPSDRGFPEYDVGVTGLAVLAFTGYGHTHRDGVYPEYVECLRNAVAYLRRVQVRSEDPASNGRYGDDGSEHWIYNHSIATMAMAELLVMSNDILGLRRSVTDAVKLCLRAQNPGFGWRYGIRPGSNDTSVTGWMVLALKTAKNARLEIPDEEYERAFAGALTWFDRATSSGGINAGRTGYMGPGDPGSTLNDHPDNPYPYSKELSCMTAVAVLCRLFAGESRKTDAVEAGVDLLLREPPTWQEQKGRALSRVNIYYWYYGSYALFQFGGKPWKEWNEHMQEALLKNQRQGNIDEDGSWDPIGEWGIAGGRVYSTAIGAMTLEVYYRFRRAEQGIGL